MELSKPSGRNNYAIESHQSVRIAEIALEIFSGSSIGIKCLTPFNTVKVTSNPSEHRTCTTSFSTRSFCSTMSSSPARTWILSPFAAGRKPAFFTSREMSSGIPCRSHPSLAKVFPFALSRKIMEKSSSVRLSLLESTFSAVHRIDSSLSYAQRCCSVISGGKTRGVGGDGATKTKPLTRPSETSGTRLRVASATFAPIE